MNKLIMLFSVFSIMVTSNILAQDTLTYPRFEYFDKADGTGNRVFVQPDSGYIILGTLHNSGSNGGNTITKFDKKDNLLWQNVYDSFAANASYKLEQKDGSDIYVQISDSEFLPTGGVKTKTIVGSYKQDGTINWEKEIQDTLGNKLLIVDMKFSGNNLYIVGLRKSNDSFQVEDILCFGLLDSLGNLNKMNSLEITGAFIDRNTRLFPMHDSLVVRSNIINTDSGIQQRYPFTLIYDSAANLLNSYFGNTPVVHSNTFDDLANKYTITYNIQNGIGFDFEKTPPQLNTNTIFSVEPTSTDNRHTTAFSVPDSTYPVYLGWIESTSDTSLAYILKFDELGQISWQTQIPISALPNAPKILDKGILFNGDLVGFYHYWVDPTIGTEGEPYIFQLTSNGEKYFSWKIDLDETKNWTKDIAIDQENNIIITGESFRDFPDNGGMFVAKITPPLYIKDSISSTKLLDTKSSNISLSPNPISNYTYLYINSATIKKQKAILRIIDTNGRIVKSKPLNLEKEESKIYIDNLSDLQSGAYWFSIESKTWTAAVQGIIE